MHVLPAAYLHELHVCRPVVECWAHGIQPLGLSLCQVPASSGQHLNSCQQGVVETNGCFVNAGLASAGCAAVPFSSHACSMSQQRTSFPLPTTTHHTSRSTTTYGRRLVELERGRVEVDGVDISRLHLATLRQSIALIPQVMCRTRYERLQCVLKNA